MLTFLLQAKVYGQFVGVVYWAYIIVIASIAAFMILWLFSDTICKIRFKSNISKPKIVWIVATATTFCVFMFCLIPQFPGAASPDTTWQYKQAVGQLPYNDWHPVLHTLIFYTIPLKLGFGYSGVVAAHIFCFSLAFGYLIYSLAYNDCPLKFIVSICLYIWINPCMSTFLVTPWKDIAFMAFAVYVTACYIQIVFSKGAWFENKINVILFSIGNVLCCFMRHNGILFTVPILLLTLFYVIKKNNKLRILLVAVTVAFYVLGKLIIFGVGAEKPGMRTVETIGVPVAMWCNVIQNNPDALSEETRELLYSFVEDQEDYKTYFHGTFNDIKGRMNQEKMNELSYLDVIKITLECIRKDPGNAFMGFAYTTKIVWAMDGKTGPETAFYCETDIFNIYRDPPLKFTFLNVVDVLSHGAGAIVFSSLGFMLIICLSVSMILLSKGRLGFIHFAPLFVYDYGTMMFHSGYDFRFFVLTIPLWMPTIFLMLRDDTIIHTKYAK